MCETRSRCHVPHAAVADGAVELVSAIGYYAMVGMLLKSFDVRPPDGSTPLK